MTVVIVIQHVSKYTSLGYIGYFDGVSNTKVANKVKCYNSDTEMNIDGKEYTGEPNTMIIQITCKDGIITLDWVKGE